MILCGQMKPTFTAKNALKLKLKPCLHSTMTDLCWDPKDKKKTGSSKTVIIVCCFMKVAYSSNQIYFKGPRFQLGKWVLVPHYECSSTVGKFSDRGIPNCGSFLLFKHIASMVKHYWSWFTWVNIALIRVDHSWQWPCEFICQYLVWCLDSWNEICVVSIGLVAGKTAFCH